MPLMFLDNKLLFVGGALSMAEACCCEDVTPKACGDCGMSSSSQFQVEIPGIGTYVVTNIAYGPTVNCTWSYPGAEPNVCGNLAGLGVQWNAANGGWNVNFSLWGGSPLPSWRSNLDEELLGCGPWMVDCTQNFGSFGACAKTSVMTYTVTVTLIP